jgi:sugar phosphate isomerase/epimerase
MAHRIGVCSWSLRPRSSSDLAASLDRIGIRAVQIALGPLVDDEPTWARTIDDLRCGGIDVISGMMAMAGEDYSTLESIARTGGVRPDSTWPANRAHAQRVAQLAGSAGLQLVTFHGGFVPESRSDPQRAVMLERLRIIADLFSARGVGVALETGQETARTLIDALHELNHPNVGVNFDPANMILYGQGDPVEAIGHLAAHVRQVHIKDALPAAAAGAWGEEVPVGRGTVQWPRFVAVVAGLRPTVDLVIERESGEDREGDIGSARDLLARLGVPDESRSPLLRGTARA